MSIEALKSLPGGKYSKARLRRILGESTLAEARRVGVVTGNVILDVVPLGSHRDNLMENITTASIPSIPAIHLELIKPDDEKVESHEPGQVPMLINKKLPLSESGILKKGDRVQASNDQVRRAQEYLASQGREPMRSGAQQALKEKLERRGTIEEVISDAQGYPAYRIKWDDGRQSDSMPHMVKLAQDSPATAPAPITESEAPSKPFLSALYEADLEVGDPAMIIKDGKPRPVLAVKDGDGRTQPVATTDDPEIIDAKGSDVVSTEELAKLRQSGLLKEGVTPSKTTLFLVETFLRENSLRSHHPERVLDALKPANPGLTLEETTAALQQLHSEFVLLESQGAYSIR